VASGRCLRTFEGHANNVEAVALSADGRYALSGSVDTTLKLWEVASGVCLRTFEGNNYAVSSVDLSVDGRYALSGSYDKIKLWDRSNGRCLRTFEGHKDSVASVWFSVEGSYVISASLDNTLKLWEVASGNCLRTFEGHGWQVSSVFLSTDGSHVLSGSYNGMLKLWALDWELEDKEPADWDEGARPHLEIFLTLHTPYSATLPQDREPTEEEITLALTRRGVPSWTEDDFQHLLYTLGCAGYGWLRPEGVRWKLEEIAATRKSNR
jgi:WD40 repeat protein